MPLKNEGVTDVDALVEKIREQTLGKTKALSVNKKLVGNTHQKAMSKTMDHFDLMVNSEEESFMRSSSGSSMNSKN